MSYETIPATKSGEPLRIGCLGVGLRGRDHLKTLLAIGDVEVPAVYDIDSAAAAKAQEMVAQSGRKPPEVYTTDTGYERLLARGDLDAVIIATPWESHAALSVAAMKAGLYVGVEVPCALTLDECWDLVKASEATGSPCMMLENWSYLRDNLAVLNMIRQRLLGEIVHCHCAHSHNCINWYFDAQGNPTWGGRHLLSRNADQYCTHSLGPVLSWMDINCGDRFDYVTSMATRPLGVKDQIERKFGKDHPSAKLSFLQGDVVTTMVKTVKGSTIVIAMDMQLPRPYDDRWQIQGTRGLYNQQRDAVYIEGRSPKIEGPGPFQEQWEPFSAYRQQYDHWLWKNLSRRMVVGQEHGGPDSLVMTDFLQAVRMKTQPPIDVYDSVIMSVITPLSEQSIAAGSAVVKCPDFTSGRWETTKPRFAI